LTSLPHNPKSLVVRTRRSDGEHESIGRAPDAVFSIQLYTIHISWRFRFRRFGRRTRSIDSTFLPTPALRRKSLDSERPPSYIGSVSTVDDQRQRLEFLQGTLEVLILRSLQAAPNHAYGISQFLEKQSENEFLVDNGSLYPALQRLLQRKWIAAQWKTSPNGRRANYYRLTALGRKQLVAAKSKWLRFVEAMGRILVPEG
jgi:PadR family transcriptional regulator, regulatory protein PadR